MYHKKKNMAMGGMNMPRVMKKNDMPGGGMISPMEMGMGGKMDYGMGGKMDMGHGGDMARAIKIYLMRKGGKTFPDLTGDGKVTFADILKGRKVKLKKKSQAYGGQVMENGGKSDPPRIDDLSNIRLLQGPDGNQFFLKQGEDQYLPLGGGRQLRENLGQDRFQEYMATIGLTPNPEGGGFKAAEGVGEGELGPLERADRQFRQEYFGTPRGRGRDAMGREGFGDREYDRTEVQRSHQEDFVKSLQEQEDDFGLMDDYIRRFGTERGPEKFAAQMDLPMMAKRQQAYMMDQLLRGRGGRGGSL